MIIQFLLSVLLIGAVMWYMGSSIINSTIGNEELLHGSSNTNSTTTIEELLNGSSSTNSTTTIEELLHGISSTNSTTTIEELLNGSSSTNSTTTTEELLNGSSRTNGTFTIEELFQIFDPEYFTEKRKQEREEIAKLERHNFAINAIAQSAETFAFNFSKAVAGEESGNFICSPISAWMILSMAAHGARESTADQLRTVLALPENKTVAYGRFHSIVEKSRHYKVAELRLANKMFLASDLKPKAEFRTVAESGFLSEVQSVDFHEAVNASRTINDWCESQTNNRIKNLVNPDDLDSSTTIILVNAVYFLGQWKNKFDDAMTTPRPFYINGTTLKNVTTMHTLAVFKYGEISELNAKFIELPYQSDYFHDIISMYILLPDEIDGLDELEKNIQKVTKVKLNGLDTFCNVYLPKFKIESDLNLNEALSKMGLTDMFNERANFSGITDAPLKVSKVVQKAFFEVTEEGCEAAAFTGLGISWRSGIPESIEDPVDFIVDRPAHFFIAMQDVILFSGSIRNPLSN